MKKLINILLYIYLILLTFLIVFKLSFDIGITRNLNLIPFHYDNDMNVRFHIKEVIENIIIFIPLGILLKMKNKKKIILSGLLLSITFELLQYILKTGFTDTTDVITNTTGTIIGVYIYKLFKKIFKEKTNKIIVILSLLFLILFVILFNLLFIANNI